MTQQTRENVYLGVQFLGKVGNFATEQIRTADNRLFGAQGKVFGMDVCEGVGAQVEQTILALGNTVLDAFDGNGDCNNMLGK